MIQKLLNIKRRECHVTQETSQGNVEKKKKEAEEVQERMEEEAVFVKNSNFSAQ